MTHLLPLPVPAHFLFAVPILFPLQFLPTFPIHLWRDAIPATRENACWHYPFPCPLPIYCSNLFPFLHPHLFYFYFALFLFFLFFFYFAFIFYVCLTTYRCQWRCNRIGLRLQHLCIRALKLTTQSLYTLI